MFYDIVLKLKMFYFILFINIIVLCEVELTMYTMELIV
jgi:hypothetical protein